MRYAIAAMLLFSSSPSFAQVLALPCCSKGPPRCEDVKRVAKEVARQEVEMAKLRRKYRKEHADNAHYQWLADHQDVVMTYKEWSRKNKSNCIGK